jgi:iron complex outermembrane receptor protein
MKKITIVIASALLCGAGAMAQDQPDSLKVEQLQQAVVSAVRASKEAPFSVSNIDRTSLRDFSSTGKELPALFARTPGVIAWSENGIGTGTSYMRIRGA